MNEVRERGEGGMVGGSVGGKGERGGDGVRKKGIEGEKSVRGYG